MHFGQIVVHFPAQLINESSSIQGMRIDLLPKVKKKKKKKKGKKNVYYLPSVKD